MPTSQSRQGHIEDDREPEAEVQRVQESSEGVISEQSEERSWRRTAAAEHQQQEAAESSAEQGLEQAEDEEPPQASVNAYRQLAPLDSEESDSESASDAENHLSLVPLLFTSDARSVSESDISVHISEDENTQPRATLVQTRERSPDPEDSHSQDGCADEQGGETVDAVAAEQRPRSGSSEQLRRSDTNRATSWDSSHSSNSCPFAFSVRYPVSMVQSAPTSPLHFQAHREAAVQRSASITDVTATAANRAVDSPSTVCAAVHDAGQPVAFGHTVRAYPRNSNQDFCTACGCPEPAPVDDPEYLPACLTRARLCSSNSCPCADATHPAYHHAQWRNSREEARQRIFLGQTQPGDHAIADQATSSGSEDCCTTEPGLSETRNRSSTRPCSTPTCPSFPEVSEELRQVISDSATNAGYTTGDNLTAQTSVSTTATIEPTIEVDQTGASQVDEARHLDQLFREIQRSESADQGHSHQQRRPSSVKSDETVYSRPIRDENATIEWIRYAEEQRRQLQMEKEIRERAKARRRTVERRKRRQRNLARRRADAGLAAGEITLPAGAESSTEDEVQITFAPATPQQIYEAELRAAEGELHRIRLQQEHDLAEAVARQTQYMRQQLDQRLATTRQQVQEELQHRRLFRQQQQQCLPQPTPQQLLQPVVPQPGTAGEAQPQHEPSGLHGLQRSHSDPNIGSTTPPSTSSLHGVLPKGPNTFLSNWPW